VHPKNPDIVYVAAQGHVWGPNQQRGVFRSKDGGKTWEKVLFRSDKAGACDLIIDPTNPNVLYAGFWEVYRKPWTMESGGAGSGIFKSTDGGDTWTEITRNQGLPKGTIGIVGITVSPANSDRLWRLFEAEDGGVFRSTTAAEPGQRRTSSAICASAPGTTRASTPIRKMPNGLRAQHRLLSIERRRPHLYRHWSAARRQSRSMDRARRPEPHDREQ